MKGRRVDVENSCQDQLGRASAGSHDHLPATQPCSLDLPYSSPRTDPSLLTGSLQFAPSSCESDSYAAIIRDPKSSALVRCAQGVTRHGTACQSTNHVPILITLPRQHASSQPGPPAEQGDDHAHLFQATCTTSVQAASTLRCPSRGPTIRSSACPRCSDHQNTRKFHTLSPGHTPLTEAKLTPLSRQPCLSLSQRVGSSSLIGQTIPTKATTGRRETFLMPVRIQCCRPWLSTGK